jgi:septum formation protein
VTDHPPLILASASPRRRELLALLGLPFEVDPTGEEEALPAEHAAPARVAMRLARAKAAAVAARRPGCLVVGADTIVVLGRRLLGKPVDPEHARAMLRALAGRAHRVVTGVAVIDRRRHPATEQVSAESTRVEFRPLDPREIAAYVGTGEPMDKAGAYAVQGVGSLLIRSIHGDYPNVVGLPVARLARLLRNLEVPILGLPDSRGTG